MLKHSPEGRQKNMLTEEHASNEWAKWTEVRWALNENNYFQISDSRFSALMTYVGNCDSSLHAFAKSPVQSPTIRTCMVRYSSSGVWLITKKNRKVRDLTRMFGKQDELKLSATQSVCKMSYCTAMPHVEDSTCLRLQVAFSSQVLL